jgi:type II secretion system protein N
MPRIVRYIAYLALFVVSFLVFLYWSFPYEILKDRIAGTLERQLGQAVEASIDELDPHWFTGVDMRGLVLEGAGPEGPVEIINIKRVRARASLFSLLLGRPRVSFRVQIGKGRLSGRAAVTDEVLDLDMDVDDLDLGLVGLIGQAIGLSLSSRLDGYIRLNMDRERPLRSTGRVSLDLRDIRIKPSNLRLGEMELPLPDITLSTGRGSAIDLDVGRGVMTVKKFKLEGGDLEIDVRGRIFLSTRLENYRLNLSGTFKTSEKLGEVLPFMFIVEKQKLEDGSYPISVTGRLSRPAVKIGTFSLPI